MEKNIWEGKMRDKWIDFNLWMNAWYNKHEHHPLMGVFNVAFGLACTAALGVALSIIICIAQFVLYGALCNPFWE
jgi:hypothetical protein